MPLNATKYKHRSSSSFSCTKEPPLTAPCRPFLVFGIASNTGESSMLEVDLFEIDWFVCCGCHLGCNSLEIRNRIDNTISSVTKVKSCSLS